MRWRPRPRSKSMGNAALGIITVSDYDFNHQSPMNKEFVKVYKDEFHRNPDFFSIGGYDGAHLIYAAWKRPTATETATR